MRILWFTNCLLSRAYGLFGLRQSYHGGGWMEALLDAVRERHPEIEFCVATTGPVARVETRCEGGVQYLCFPHRRILGRDRVQPMLAEAVEIVRRISPDLVHVHGSELFYGRISEEKKLNCPITVSLQGLIGPYSEWPCFFGNHTPWEVLRFQKIQHLLKGQGLVPDYLRFRRDALRERKVIGAVENVMGRTRWDRDFAMAVNPALDYYHVGELLRRPFWGPVWDLNKCRRHTIIFTNAGHPRKGTEVLLEAFRIVSKQVPDASLLIAGSISPSDPYGASVCRRIAGLGRKVRLLGMLSAQELAETLTASPLALHD